MQLRGIAVLSCISVFVFVDAVSGSESKNAVETIQDFYKRYLSYSYHKTPNVKRPLMIMSKSFSKAVKKNNEVCAAYVSGICGWGADEDEYLDTQETDPKLSFQNSGIKFIEIAPNLVQVKLNVYPSEKDASGYYDKTITYKMVREKGSWVMDDITYADGVSLRKKMAIENSYAIAHPDPDTPAAKQGKKKKQ